MCEERVVETGRLDSSSRKKDDVVLFEGRSPILAAMGRIVAVFRSNNKADEWRTGVWDSVRLGASFCRGVREGGETKHFS